MQNPAFWARLGLLWCLFIFAACWCAGAKASPPGFSGIPAMDSRAILVAPADPVRTTIAVTNSPDNSMRAVTTNGAIVHPIPTLDGFGLFILAGLLGVAALWLWRRRE
jgi:hypothetical protein